MRSHHGERDGWRGVQGPSVEAEDHRHLPRDLETLKQARARTTTRIQGLLSRQGVRLTSRTTLPEQLDPLRRWEGSPLRRGRPRRVLRGDAPHQFLSEQSAEGEAERRALLQSAQAAHIEQVRQVRHRRGIGIHGAWWLVMACFGWRALKNRREVGG